MSAKILSMIMISFFLLSSNLVVAEETKYKPGVIYKELCTEEFYTMKSE
jgi:hypothetical protein